MKGNVTRFQQRLWLWCSHSTSSREELQGHAGTSHQCSAGGVAEQDSRRRWMDRLNWTEGHLPELSAPVGMLVGHIRPPGQGWEGALGDPAQVTQVGRRPQEPPGNGWAGPAAEQDSHQRALTRGGGTGWGCSLVTSQTHPGGRSHRPGHGSADTAALPGRPSAVPCSKGRHR